MRSKITFQEVPSNWDNKSIHDRLYLPMVNMLIKEFKAENIIKFYTRAFIGYSVQEDKQILKVQIYEGEQLIGIDRPSEEVFYEKDKQ